MPLRYLHTMVRVKDLERSMRFYELLGLREIRRSDNEGGRFTLVFMAPPGQDDTPVELTHNWTATRACPATAGISGISPMGWRISTPPAST